MNEYQWKGVSVVGFDELMRALDYADRKGFMPDAIKAEWDAFNWKPEQPAQQQEPVLWLVNGVVQASEIPKDYTGCLFTSPQRKPWVGLTWDDMPDSSCDDPAFLAGAQWANSKLKEKNA